jgi:hypothetical protein
MRGDEDYVIVVIDDMRKPPPLESGTGLLYKTLDDGLAALKEIHTSMGRINELWLDHDLGIDDVTGDFYTIMPVVDWLDEIAREGDPFDVDYIMVHTSNPSAAGRMIQALSPNYKTMRMELPR